MRITYIEHARERMRLRNITEAEVKAVLEDPQTTMPANKGRTKYIRHNVGTHEQVAVVAMIRKVSTDHYVVYTVF